MTGLVDAWKQAGSVYLWRYPPRAWKHRGWHFTSNDAGVASLVDLMDAMQAEGRVQHRTIALVKPTDAIWQVPNFGKPSGQAPSKLRLDYEPVYPGFAIVEVEDRLNLTIGDARFPELRSAIVEIGIGGGDFAMWSDDKGAETPIWFWWLPRARWAHF